MDQIINSSLDHNYESVPLVMSVPELARQMGIGRNAAYDIVNAGLIRSVRIGKTIRIPRTALIEFLEQRAG